MKAFKAKNVDDYIANQPEELIEMLVHIRHIIQSVAPDAEEVISYRIPCYKLHGMFVGFGTHKGGCSLYAMNTKILGEFGKELDNKGIKYSGSTVHFGANQKLPVALIKKMVKARMKQNIEKQRGNSKNKIPNSKLANSKAKIPNSKIPNK